MSVGATGPDSGFGSRLRQMRRQAGLSQTEVAGSDLHPSYVSLLESGKRTPTSEVVALLAARLHCTPEYLLDGESPETAARLDLALTYAEIALRNGEAAVALQEIEAASTGERHSAEQDRRLDTLHAQALEGVGRLREAAKEYERLSDEAAERGRWTEHVERLIDLSRCYQEVGDTTYALELGLAALAKVTDLGLRGSDLHARLAATVVGGYYLRNDLARAAAVAEEALADLAGGSARARGSVLWNASLVAQADGRIEDALPLAEQALALFADGDDARAIGRLRLAYGWLLLRDSPPRLDEARAVLTAAREGLGDVGTAADLASCDTELAVAALALDEPDVALEHIEAARARLDDTRTLAYAGTQLIRARALLAQHQRTEAVAEYRAAAATLAQLDLSRQAAAAWRELADAFTALELFQDAALAYQQALTDAGVPPAPGTRSTLDPRRRSDSAPTQQA